MQNKVYISTLNDYYGGMLTQHQQNMVRLYYCCDMSLSEIAEETGITRQGVRENLLRATKKLTECENKLGLVAKIKEVSDSLEGIIDSLNDEPIKKEMTCLLKKIKEI